VRYEQNYRIPNHYQTKNLATRGPMNGKNNEAAKKMIFENISFVGKNLQIKLFTLVSMPKKPKIHPNNVDKIEKIVFGTLVTTFLARCLILSHKPLGV